MPNDFDVPEDVRELLRDAWTLISRNRDDDDPKFRDWRERFHARLGVDPSRFGDDPDTDDVP